ncbi:hypothetical protein HPB50_024917 [Hyalomma asiaticum]|uniref:Uncharacterized protein n=1 Tax=Hyalomma asiaticum TaxID=266040 RepID=A0ACB7SSR1_HYAAI|nr:hypothetical protein HPB50_024917 [Hyalomma asiaticum]
MLARSLRIIRNNFNDLEVELTPAANRKPKPDPSKLVFGQEMSDHMFMVRWTSAEGWGKPKISPLRHLELHPAAKVLHYAQELFEGLKAFRGHDDKVRLFRPDMNVRRLLNSAARLDLPKFDGDEFLKCLTRLVSLEKEWVPKYPMSSLYIRPTLIGIENEFKVSERKITMAEIREALKEGRLLEMFGCGTACVICPIERLHHRGENLHIPTMEQSSPLANRVLKAITDIQYGAVPHSWAIEVE